MIEEESGVLQPMASQRVGHTSATERQQHGARNGFYFFFLIILVFTFLNGWKYIKKKKIKLKFQCS